MTGHTQPMIDAPFASTTHLLYDTTAGTTTETYFISPCDVSLLTFTAKLLPECSVIEDVCMPAYLCQSPPWPLAVTLVCSAVRTTLPGRSISLLLRFVTSCFPVVQMKLPFHLPRLSFLSLTPVPGGIGKLAGRWKCCDSTGSDTRVDHTWHVTPYEYGGRFLIYCTWLALVMHWPGTWGRTPSQNTP